jgi:serine/threonine protein kinase
MAYFMAAQGGRAVVWWRSSARPVIIEAEQGIPQEQSRDRHGAGCIREKRSMATDTGSWVGLGLVGGRYEVTAQLGAGGMGLVYRARDRQLERDVVVKAPRRAMLENPEFAGRFAREVRSLVRLSHPHIVKVIDVGEHDGFPFAILEYLAGGSLRDRLRRRGSSPATTPLEELRSWLGEIAAALDFMHQHGTIHRDVKPENILFDAGGHVYLSDFGIAKALSADETTGWQTRLTGTGAVLGTAQYMAPEVILGKGCDGRADQYSLAATVYEWLSGQVPFDGPTPAAIALLQMHQPAPPLHTRWPVPRVVSAAVQKALSREPENRYPDCKSFAGAVLAAAQEPPPAEPPRQAVTERPRRPASRDTLFPPPPPAPRPRQSSPLVLVLVVCVAAGLFLALNAVFGWLPIGWGHTAPLSSKASTKLAASAVPGQADNPFGLAVVPSAVGVLQGEPTTITVRLDRGKNFDQDVKITFRNLPRGVTITPDSAEIKAGATEVQVQIKASKDAAVGEHIVTVTGTGAKSGAESSVRCLITVKMVDG